MENQPKLHSSKEVIAFLAKRFPLCFSVEGEAHPLKIGIFQDLIARIKEEDNLSKTRLRSALRLYTSSWRYLYSVKVGAQRIDLDGHACGFLEQQHEEHARKQLQEAKARVQAQRAERQAKQREANAEQADASRRPRSATKKPAPRWGKTPAEDADQKTRKSHPPGVSGGSNPASQTPVTDISVLQIGQEIKVRAGKSAMDATVLEIAKDGVRVQLSSGLAMIVRAEHLQF